MKTSIVILSCMFVTLLAADAYASPTEERTYTYYGFYHGYVDGQYCICKIGPCSQYGDVIGQKTYACNGAVYSWGITQGTCFTKIELETAPCGTAAQSGSTGDVSQEELLQASSSKVGSSTQGDRLCGFVE